MKEIAEAANNELETLETSGFQSSERSLCPPNLTIVSLPSSFVEKNTLKITGPYVRE
jgi:hypothetical protein